MVGIEKIHWKHPFPPKDWVIAIASPVFDAGKLFVSSFFEGALMLEVDPQRLAVTKTWQRRGAGGGNRYRFLVRCPS